MKLFIPFLLFLLNMTASAQFKKIDRSTNNLQGAVKSITTVYHRAEEKFGELTKQSIQMTETEEYNKDGLLTFSKLVIGSSTTRTTYKYDKANNLIEKKEDEDGEATLVQAIYNADGKEIELNTFDKKGALETKLKKKYNEQGQLITASLYNGDGTLREKETFSYNEKKYLDEKTTSNAKGEEKKMSTYKFSDKGLLLEEITFTYEKLISFVYYVNKYDDKDRVILKKKSLPDGESFEDTKIEYDTFGNITNEFTNADNYQKDKYTYDTRNNWTMSVREWNYFKNKRKYIIERSIKYY
ncbi:hypothetical protein LZZ85_09820 [Terrimonas sp. NA20]|uniref:RHS repeat protein n=1 Tax=Terrimonas ginsenosidimutans TaxID=2908004 RepID=A0ABS9KQM9_9BACT|nr:hypothetical protein [Terrimonas ginsenosidimutans]MCG2614580.1 hypothetical protein [Terrimonas ginsenosidimutans]